MEFVEFVTGYCYGCKATTTLKVLRRGPENAIEGKCSACGQQFAGALLPTDKQETGPRRKIIKVF